MKRRIMKRSKDRAHFKRDASRTSSRNISLNRGGTRL